MFLSLGHLTKKCFLFLVVPIAMFLRLLLVGKTTSKRLFYHGFLRFFARSSNVFLWLIVKKLIVENKKDKKDKKENKDSKIEPLDQNNTEPNNSDSLDKDQLSDKNNFSGQYEIEIRKKIKTEKKNNFKKMLLLILVCFLDFISVICNIIIVKNELYKESSYGLICLTFSARLFIIAFLSHIIIKNTKLYKHHLLSIIILIIVVIATNIASRYIEKDGDYFRRLGLLILPEILFSFTYVWGAKYLYITNGNVYKLLFIDGTVGVILLILLHIFVYYLIPCNLVNKIFYDLNCQNLDGGFEGMIDSFGFREFDATSILLIIVNFCEICSIWLLIFHFSVNHFGAVCSIQLFATFFRYKGVSNFIMYFFGIISIVFAVSVYNEIIILRFCGLDKNTAEEISKRSVEDLLCYFGNDDEEIYTKTNSNYIIMKGDILGPIDENNEKI